MSGITLRFIAGFCSTIFSRTIIVVKFTKNISLDVFSENMTVGIPVC
jgi:hypothetical protein